MKNHIGPGRAGHPPPLPPVLKQDHLLMVTVGPHPSSVLKQDHLLMVTQLAATMEVMIMIMVIEVMINRRTEKGILHGW